MVGLNLRSAVVGVALLAVLVLVALFDSSKSESDEPSNDLYAFRNDLELEKSAQPLDLITPSLETELIKGKEEYKYLLEEINLVLGESNRIYPSEDWFKYPNGRANSIGGGVNPDTGLIAVYFSLNDALTASERLHAVQLDVYNILKTVKNSKIDYEGIFLEGTFAINENGWVNERRVFNVDYKKDEIDKINFERKSYGEAEDLASNLLLDNEFEVFDTHFTYGVPYWNKAFETIFGVKDESIYSKVSTMDTAVSKSEGILLLHPTVVFDPMNASYETCVTSMAPNSPTEITFIDGEWIDSFLYDGDLNDEWPGRPVHFAHLTVVEVAELVPESPGFEVIVNIFCQFGGTSGFGSELIVLAGDSDEVRQLGESFYMHQFENASGWTLQTKYPKEVKCCTSEYTLFSFEWDDGRWEEYKSTTWVKEKWKNEE